MVFLKKVMLGLFLSIFSATALAKADFSPSLNKDRSLVLLGPVMENVVALIPKLVLLSQQDKSEPINLVISSPGGSVVAGFLFISAMEHVKAAGTPIRCYVPDMAASMAYQILLHCSERYVLNNSMLLFHRVRVFLGGGFGGGTVLTGPAASVLSKDLLAMDNIIWADLVKLMSMDKQEMLYHFEQETFHVGANLCRLSPGTFNCVDVMPGVIPFLLEQAGLLNKITTPRKGFKDGSIIYMLPATMERK
jgi:ATP-dependent protease ClpP protease subunit